MAAAMETQGSQERLLALRDMRVACNGSDGEIEVIPVRAGDPFPENARGRADVLIRTGYVVRFDENGELDKRSWKFGQRLRWIGIERPQKAPVVLARARHLRAMASRAEGGSAVSEAPAAKGSTGGTSRPTPRRRARKKSTRAKRPRAKR